MSADTAAGESDGRRRRGARRRAALLDACAAVIARDGVAGVTHRAVAAEAGVGKSAVTHHFASLDDLLVATLRADTEQLVATLSAASDGTPADPAALAAELAGFAAGRRERVLVGYDLSLLAARRAVLRPAVQLWLGVLAGLLRPHAADELAVRAAVALVDGYLLQSLAAGTEPDADELRALLGTVLGVSPGTPGSGRPGPAGAAPA